MAPTRKPGTLIGEEAPMRTKRCEICGEEFVPSPRHWGQQKVCKKASCRKERNRRAQKAWEKKHPDCYGGRYPALKKSWDYAGYQREYRAENPGYVAADNLARGQRRRREAKRADIQETVARRREAVVAIRSRRGADIQETVKLKLDGVLDYLDGVGADIQISMAGVVGVGIR